MSWNRKTTLRPAWIDSFIEGCTEEEEASIKMLVESANALPTGSRFICPSSTKEDSDWDVFFKGSVAWLDSGWSLSGSVLGSYRKARVNAIRLSDREYSAFFKATRLCHAVGGPTSKKERIEVFEAIENGTMPKSLFPFNRWEIPREPGLFWARGFGWDWSSLTAVRVAEDGSARMIDGGECCSDGLTRYGERVA